MEKSSQTATILIALLIILQETPRTEGEARAQIINMTCDHQRENNQTLFIPNFVNVMGLIGTQIRTSLNGTAVVGTGPDSNYGLAQCYNDLSTQDCILCYSEARTVLPSCFPNNGGRIYLDGCFMRVQNYSFYHEYTGPNDRVVCGNMTRKNVLFGDTVKRAVLNAVTDATRNGGYFSRVRMVVASRNDSAYVLAECWRTLSPDSCRACLENASGSITKCLPWSEGRVLNTGCFMRYSDVDFLNHVSVTKSSSNKGKKIAIIVSVVSSLAVLTVALMVGVYIRKQRYIQKKRKGSYDAKKMSKMLNDSSLNFKYSTVEKATGNWDESNKLGQGGFGTVYKGVLLDGREIAVKRLYFNNKFRAADFYNEVNMISSVEHKNLVRLLGCSCLGPESILVYEYLPNMSLDRFIFDGTRGKALNWEKRFDILIGTAEGLVYLHENTKCRMIHRDIKASNILLDVRLRAKIADFGLARSFQDDKSHISTAIAGTLGYMAPEYLAHGQLTEKADVYSFGVLILEVVTGMENNRSKTTEYTDSLVAIAWYHFQQHKVEEIFDPNLMMHIYPNIKYQKEAVKVVQVGLLCTQEAPSLRPSMSTVLKMLAKDDEPLPAPSNPPFIDDKTMELNHITQRSCDYFNSDDSGSVATVDNSHFFPRSQVELAAIDSKMKKSSHTTLTFITLIIVPLLVSKSNGDARTQIIKIYCDQGFQNNQTLYVPNFVRAMQIISTALQTSHNATAVVGSGPNENYALAQCYSDLSIQDCLLCYAEIRTYFPSCYPQSGGRIYLDGCFMRLQNYSYFEDYTGPNDTNVCGNTTRKSMLFQNATRRAVSSAVTGAVENNDYFAREEMLVPGTNRSVYVLAECWKTLSPSSCRACLENASTSILNCLPWSEGRVLNTGCFMRYSDTNFLNPIVIASTSRSSNTGKIIAIVVSVVSSVVVFTVVLMIVLYVRRHRYIQQKRKGYYDADKMAKVLNDSSLNFKYSSIEKATGNWDEANKLGQGGFGTVYKGVLSDGREIAVKRLFFNNKFRAADFYNEVNMISSVEHKNLVRLLGCSCSGPESILVYEYLPNMSLNLFIFDEIKGRELSWEKRFEIIIGVAEGLVYLHENNKTRIIHRDIKASNILLDLRLRAKIADFGLARSFQDDKSHISTAIAGTLGYMAPEYLAHGQLTEKADVYSFGVLILEVVTGMENNRSKSAEYTESLLSTAWKHFKKGTVEEILDPNLMMHLYPNINFQKDAIKAVHVGLLCTQEAASLRPSMSAALKMLAKTDEPLPTPSNPPFIDENTMELNNITQKLLNYRDGDDDSSSVATVSHSHFYPR
ncbi:hypothetical protein SSX86_017330 [Deinandra increscens subsp. villosa]|uniref:Cysteine-rich receptor-like protein kinase 2 n=1 Tax=Deinandra increscens subsp. villosa TaxID=3103831 RepID=A0AAP0CUV7_9ASTR